MTRKGEGKSGPIIRVRGNEAREGQNRRKDEWWKLALKGQLKPNLTENRRTEKEFGKEQTSRPLKLHIGHRIASAFEWIQSRRAEKRMGKSG